MQYLTVKNWREFQHYKDRNPPWIKLHRAIVDDYAFAALKDKTKAHLMLIWILAAGLEGRIPHDAPFVARRIGATDAVDLDSMVAAGFLIAEEGFTPTEKQKRKHHVNGSPVKFDSFYTQYPLHVKRAAALKAWIKIAPDDELYDRIMLAIEAQKRGPQWTREGGKFIPHPASWLNGKRWEDEVAPQSAKRVAI